MYIFVFSLNSWLSCLSLDLFLTGQSHFFRRSPSLSLSSSMQSPSQTLPKLTLVHPSGIKILKAIVHLLQNVYLCIGNGRKGLISRMSDECLMKQETVFLFYTQYQAVMRKFTLAGKSGEVYLYRKKNPDLQKDLILLIIYSLVKILLIPVLSLITH